MRQTPFGVSVFLYLIIGLEVGQLWKKKIVKNYTAWYGVCFLVDYI